MTRAPILVFSLLMLAAALFAAGVQVTMFPSSSSYVVRTYDFADAGAFTFDTTDIKGTTPSQLSVFGTSADAYLIYARDVNKTREVQKSLTDLLNESVGKQVSVSLQDGSAYAGTLTWYDGSYVGVSSNGSLKVLSLSGISGLSLPDASAYKQENYSENVISVFGSAAQPNSKLSLGYAKSDLVWSITYDLIAGDSKLRQYAEMENSGDEEYANASLKLTMLKPNFISGYYGYYNYYRANYDSMYEGAAPSYSGSGVSFTPSSEDGMWSYSPSELVTISPHSTQKLIVFTDKATYVRKNVFDTSTSQETVYRVYSLNNTRDEVLPGGTVRVFENGAFVGEDTMSMLAKGAAEELFVSNVPELAGSKYSSSESTEVFGKGYKHTVTVTLKVRNYGAEAMDVDVRDYLPSYDDFKFESFSVEPYKIEGGKAYWNVSVKPGQEQVIEYTYSYTTVY